MSIVIAGQFKILQSKSKNNKRSKAIPITGCGNLWDFEDPTLSTQLAHRCWCGCQPHSLAVLSSPETLYTSVSGTFLLEVD
jgi:hypothetical protein